MAHIVAGVILDSLSKRKLTLEFLESSATLHYNDLTSQMADMTNEHSGDKDYNPDSDWELRQLQYKQQEYDSQVKSYESQLKELNAEIDSYKKLQETNTKADCTFSVSSR